MKNINTPPPKLSNEFLNWVAGTHFKDKNILELGSGYSTFFFSNYFKHVYSFETNMYWLNKIKSNLEENMINNVTLFMLNRDTLQEASFINLVKEIDFFLIDHNPSVISRYIFAKFIDENKKVDSIIVLDNGEGNIDAYNYLRDKYYCIDFPYERDNKENTETTIFFKKRNKR
jgi:hypothetical protein